jgi:hypothetical protein
MVKGIVAGDFVRSDAGGVVVLGFAGRNLRVCVRAQLAVNRTSMNEQRICRMIPYSDYPTWEVARMRMSGSVKVRLMVVDVIQQRPGCTAPLQI